MTATALAADHDAQMERARLALDGLSVGDTFGNSICIPGQPDSLHRPLPLPYQLRPTLDGEAAVVGRQRA
jgi:hypothetical protein